MRYAVIGSRGFRNLAIAAQVVSSLPAGSVVVSGGARGVDQCAARAARRAGLQVVEIRPDYARHPPRIAPLIRNKQIVAGADRVLAFWDCTSTGTMNAVRHALKAGRSVMIWLEDGTNGSMA